mgnify:FL=1|jgi:UDP-N-acetylglucosamine 2-epimerase (non-hydrolysing)
MKKTIIHVVGARPNFMKIAPIFVSFEKQNQKNNSPFIDQFIVHTGQHYGKEMSESFFSDLGIPDPHFNLNVGSGSHAFQTANIMLSFEGVLNELSPNLVIVVGDVNSTVACAITAKKLGIRVAHVESGLRSFDRSMPEEINRILTDSISDLLFTTEQSANINLNNEGISSEKIFFAGNTMIDSLVRQLENAAQINTLENINLTGSGSDHFKYGLLTMHRPANVDCPTVLAGFLESFISLSDDTPILFPAHPRTIKQIKENKLESIFSSTEEVLLNKKGMVLIDPLGYYDMLNLMRSADYVITDSGGIQEETTYLGIPCFTIRENTERPVTTDHGTNILVGQNHKLLSDEVSKITTRKQKKGTIPPLWDGKASERIVDTLTNSLDSR